MKGKYDMNTLTQPTIVIVHGAWTDASSFSAVQRMLTEDGYTVLEFANPLRSLDGDADYLTAFIESRTSGPLILVGHSYGGALVGRAALRSARVRGLVYVNAFVPSNGESLLDLLNSAGPVDPTQLFDMVPYPGAPEGDVDLYIQRGPFEPAFATVLCQAASDNLRRRWSTVRGRSGVGNVALVVRGRHTRWEHSPGAAVANGEPRRVRDLSD
jgi:pimeloyl-ACP methyl ester carboxylesterase